MCGASLGKGGGNASVDGIAEAGAAEAEATCFAINCTSGTSSSEVSLMWTRRLFQSQSSRVVTVPPPLVLVVSFGIPAGTGTGSVFRYSFFHNIENNHRPRPQHHRPQINRQPKVQTSRRAQPNTSQTDTHEKHHTPFAHATRSAPTSLPPFRRHKSIRISLRASSRRLIIPSSRA